MNRPKHVAEKILALVKSGTVFSDIQLRPEMPLIYRGAADKNVRLDDDNISVGEIEEFAEFANPEYKHLIDIGGGQFDTAFTMLDSSRLRCNFFMQGEENELAVTIRKQHLKIPAYETLGLNDDLRKIFFEYEAGLVLIVGPTGSGKTTTQFAIVDHLNNNAPFNIMTIENPIEFKVKSNQSVVTQREIPKNAETFSKAIIATKRQDLDLVMIGEVRDKDTVDAMLTAAESGCFVLAGTHAKNPEEAIEAILNYYEGAELAQKKSLLANTLIAVQSQKLIPSSDEKSKLLIYELVFNNVSIASLIRSGELNKIRNTISTTGKGASILINDVLADKVKTRQITFDAARKVSPDEKELSDRKSVV